MTTARTTTHPTPDDSPNALHQWLQAAQQRHAEQAADVAQGLLQRAAMLPADTVGADAIRLAEHVCLAHLADAALLHRLLQALPEHLAGHPATQARVQRAGWAQALVVGHPPPEPLPDDAGCWGSLHNVALAMAGLDRCAQAEALMAQHEGAALAQGSSPAGRAFAASCHNVAMELRGGPRGDAARDALMLTAAARARRAWGHAGGWLQQERADYELALCHAALGAAEGAAALVHAQACLATCEAHAADAMERFFAHEALARAHHARGDAAALAHQRATMQALLPEITEADGTRAWCAQVLADLPAPPGP